MMPGACSETWSDTRCARVPDAVQVNGFEVFFARACAQGYHRKRAEAPTRPGAYYGNGLEAFSARAFAQGCHRKRADCETKHGTPQSLETWSETRRAMVPDAKHGNGLEAFSAGAFAHGCHRQRADCETKHGTSQSPRHRQRNL